MTKTKRIMILGNSGCGKTTLAVQIGEYEGLPVYHLDRYFWDADWVEKDLALFRSIVKGFLEEDKWILDGNYIHTLFNERVEQSERIIFLDYARIFCVYRVIKRYFIYRGSARKDLCTNCPDKISMSFIKWVWGFNKRVRPTLLKVLALAKAKGKEVLIFSSKRQLRKYIKSEYGRDLQKRRLDT